MNKSDVEMVREKCHELLRRMDKLSYHCDMTNKNRESAAVIRQSMELSHALADLRHPWRPTK